jgi:hypothetical protein
MTQRADEPIQVDPGATPWETPAVEGLPFDRDSAEARAIAEIRSWSNPVNRPSDLAFDARAIREILGEPEPKKPFWRRWLERG